MSPQFDSYVHLYPQLCPRSALDTHNFFPWDASGRRILEGGMEGYRIATERSYIIKALALRLTYTRVRARYQTTHIAVLELVGAETA